MSVCLLVTLVLPWHVLAQNTNSSRGAKKSTKRKPADGPDISVIEAILRNALDWPQVASTNDSSIFYGVRTIRRLNVNVVRVWIKWKLKDDTEETRVAFLRNRKTQGLQTFGYQSFSHTLELHEYNCTTDEMRILSRIDYDDKGNILESTSYRNPEWSYIVPDSVGAALRRAVCQRRN